MRSVLFDNLSVGDNLPRLELPAITRHTLALYCGASGDHNPLHVDIDFACKVAGLDDVIGHGMLTMAYLGRLLTNWVPQAALRHFTTRFVNVSHVGDVITCEGRIVRKHRDEKDECLDVELRAIEQTGKLIATGGATVAFPRS